jgi:hypothetical protein
MALINELNEIGNAIREKTGGTELIPLKEMASAIRGISGGSVQNPYMYVTSLYEHFSNAVFSDGYELTIDAPNVTSLYSVFARAKGITKVTLKGNKSGNALSCQNSFMYTSITEVDISEFNFKPTTTQNLFNNNTVIQKIIGEIDMSSCTKTSNMFGSAPNFTDIRFKAETIVISISFAYCPQLSSESVQSIIDGLATVETAQTLTLHSSIVVSDEQKATIKSKNFTLVQ